MSYNFSDVTKIVVPEGEVYKITNSSNSVVWRKPYVWTQYTVNKQTTYKVTWASSSSNTTYNVSSMTSDLEAWSSYSVNSSGVFVGSGSKYSNNEIIYAAQGGYSSYPYVVKFAGDNVIWKVSSASTNSDMTKLYIHYYEGTITTSETETRGAATGNIFLSNSSTAYPTNGVQNGYWYYRTQVGYTG